MDRKEIKDIAAYLVSGTLAVLMGSAAFAVTWRWLSPPDTLLDWTVQICSGITVAIVIFFLSWGHFQDTPKVENQEVRTKNQES